jgi:cystathionine beta-lyase
MQHNKYDFTSIIDRRGRDAVAVDRIPFAGAEIDEGFSRIPMWVADMNFATAPAISKAILERAAHPTFGYYSQGPEFAELIAAWHEKRFGAAGITPEDIGYENGVLGGAASVISALTAPGDYILLHSPTYIGFTHTIEDMGRRIILSELVPDENGVPRMDFDDMAAKIERYNIGVAVMCAAHNPSGRVWTTDELATAAAVYEKYGVTIISDEIWADLTLFGNRHIPIQTVSDYAREHTLALYSLSKTFNLAGLVGSYHICYGKTLRNRVRKQSRLAGYNHMNVLWYRALLGAYTDGAEWVDELCGVLGENVDFAYNYITKSFEGVKLYKPEGTYMLFLDCGEWLSAHGKPLDELQRAGVSKGVIWQDGRPFHGANHIRMNLALPKSLVEEAFDRLDKFVFNV